MTAAIDRAKGVVRTAQDRASRVLAAAGLTHSEERIVTDAHQYWSDSGGRRWKGDSHWRGADEYRDDTWQRIGADHWAMFSRMTGRSDLGRVLDWGCGGGANAVTFAPQAREIIGVDVSAASVAECARQVAATGTPFRPVSVDVQAPEKAVAELGKQSCDVFISFYVFELIPSQAYGERLLRIAAELLVPGGVAFIQIKYDDGRFRSRPRRRSYRSGLANMTTYRIEDFWQRAGRCGLTPHSVALVPRNELDERYAYFLLRR